MTLSSLPWHYENRCVLDAEDEFVNGFSDPSERCGGEEEAAQDNVYFILKAVNNHNELVRCLRQLHNDIAEYAALNNIGGISNHAMKQARAILDKVRTGFTQQDQVLDPVIKEWRNL